MPAYSTPSQDGYTLRGLAPPELARRPIAERRLFWGWVVELGLKAKDRDLAKGLDKDGKPLRPISARTRKYRKSAMTPSGKGSPSAPPLTPAYQLSRTRSLLTGRAETDRAEWWWKFDPWTGDTWAKVLEHQKGQGRDVFGLSAAAIRWVRAGAMARWERFKAGQKVAAPRVPTVAQAPARIDRAGTMPTQYTTFGIGVAPPAALTPGSFTGLRTHAELVASLRTPAIVKIPGRPGTAYNTVLRHVWGNPGHPPAAGTPAGPKPRVPQPPVPRARIAAPLAVAPKPTPAAVAVAPGRFTEVAHLEAWAARAFPNATFNHDNIPMNNWNRLAVELDELAQDYPDVAARIRAINPKLDWASWPNARALSDVGSGKVLAFSPTYWSQPWDALQKDRRDAADTGWNPGGTWDPTATATHEWGHLYEAWLRKSDPNKYKALIDVFHTEGHFDKIKANQLSRYAATNTDEAFAEGFLAARQQPRSARSEPARQYAEILIP